MKNARFASLLMLILMAIAIPAGAAQPSSNAVHRSVQGIVDFVQRKGIAPVTQAPITYWSVVLHSNDVNYELSHVFGVQNGARPESAVIHGTVIHPGDQVTVEGQTHQIRKNLGLLSEINKVDVN